MENYTDLTEKYRQCEGKSPKNIKRVIPLKNFWEKIIKFAFKSITIDMKDLNRLKIVLVEKKKTSKWLAEQLGKNASTVSKWCTNTSQPDLQTLDKIASLLGCEKKELITD